MNYLGVTLFLSIVGGAALIMLLLAHYTAKRTKQKRNEFYGKHLAETEKQMRDIEKQINPSQPGLPMMLTREEKGRKRTTIYVTAVLLLVLFTCKYNRLDPNLMIVLIFAAVSIIVFMPRKKIDVENADRTTLTKEYAKLKIETENTKNAQKEYNFKHPTAPLKPYQIIAGSIVLVIIFAEIALSHPTKDTPAMIIVFSAIILLLIPVIIFIEKHLQ